MRLTLTLGTFLAAAALVATTFDAEAARPKARTFVYVHAAGTPNQLHGFQWEKDGTLTPLVDSPFVTGLTSSNCGGVCQSLGYSKKRKALVASGGDGLHVFLVNKDGSLTAGTNSPVDTAPHQFA